MKIYLTENLITPNKQPLSKVLKDQKNLLGKIRMSNQISANVKISKDQMFMSREQFNDLLAKYKNICISEQEEKMGNKGEGAMNGGGQQPTKLFIEEQYNSDLKKKFKFRASSAMPINKRGVDDDKANCCDKSLEKKNRLETLERNFFAKQSVKKRIDQQSAFGAKPKSAKPLGDQPPKAPIRVQSKIQQQQLIIDSNQTSKPLRKPDKIRENQKRGETGSVAEFRKNPLPKQKSNKLSLKNKVINPWSDNRGSIISNINEEIEERGDISTDHDITEEEFIFSEDDKDEG
jgi:hypothetical protein